MINGFEIYIDNYVCLFYRKGRLQAIRTLTLVRVWGYMVRLGNSLGGEGRGGRGGARGRVPAS